MKLVQYNSLNALLIVPKNIVNIRYIAQCYIARWEHDAQAAEQSEPGRL